MGISFKFLRDHPQYIETITDWLYSEWGNENYKFWKSWVENSLCKSDVPQTFLVFVDDTLVGTYSLWRCDLQSRQDLYPWFGGLYVIPTCRGKLFDGIKLGEHIQKHAIEQLKLLGYKEVFLFTEKEPKYYLSNGWKIFDSAPNEYDEMVTICRYDLSS